MIESETKLLPCPFCGSEAEVHITYDAEWIECKGCHLKTEAVIGDYYDEGFMDGSIAIKRWNTRVGVKEKMRVYISGPITGVPDYMEKFEKAEKELTEKGLAVVNPAKINYRMPEDMTYEEYLEIDIRLIDLCDAIYMIRGWEMSRGANREYGYALGKGKVIMGHLENLR